MTMPSPKPLGLTGGTVDNRKASKPLIEKRRRARINHSLGELKAIVVGTDKNLQKPNARPPKLEKADILEMAVEYVKKLSGKQKVFSEGDPSGFEAGYKQCYKTVCRFLDNEDHELKSRFLFYFNNSRCNPANLTELTNANTDDTSSSCSSRSRSSTPASVAVEPCQMEYSSSSPFTDSEQEVPSSRQQSSTSRTFPLHIPLQVGNKLQNSVDLPDKVYTRHASEPMICDTHQNANTMARPLNLATNSASRNHEAPAKQWPTLAAGNGYYNNSAENVWRPWHDKRLV